MSSLRLYLVLLSHRICFSIHFYVFTLLYWYVYMTTSLCVFFRFYVYTLGLLSYTWYVGFVFEAFFIFAPCLVVVYTGSVFFLRSCTLVFFCCEALALGAVLLAFCCFFESFFSFVPLSERRRTRFCLFFGRLFPTCFFVSCRRQALGLGAMLLASGEKGHRSALPNASIMLHQPRSQARGQASDIAIKAREVSNQACAAEGGVVFFFCFNPPADE